jgi:thiosulfate reductase cytochrome b subunit
MKELDKRRKWFTRQGIWRILLLSAGIMVLAATFEYAHQVVTSDLAPLDKMIYVLIMWLILFGLLLLFALLSPDLMDTLCGMLGSKDEDKV